jgi:hypothetical protein
MESSWHHFGKNLFINIFKSRFEILKLIKINLKKIIAFNLHLRKFEEQLDSILDTI